MTPEAYFESALQLFLSAGELQQIQLSIAGRSVALKSSSPLLTEQFLPSLKHLQSENSGAAELTIYLGEGDSLPAKLKAPPWSDEAFNPQGFAPDLDQLEYQIFYQPWIRQVYLYSRKHRTGIYWVYSIEEIPWWEKTFSFRILFHWWTRDLPAQLMHAGAVASDPETGFLITGPGGSGKSTTCLNLVKNGLKYLGDDYIWMEKTDQADKIIALYQTAKVEAENFHERFYEWKPYLKNEASYQKQKAVFDLKEIYPANWLPEARLKGILLPVITGLKESRVLRSKQALSLMAIAPTTLHHLPHNREISFQKISEIIMKTKTWQWKLSTEEKTNLTEFNKFLYNGTGID